MADPLLDELRMRPGFHMQGNERAPEIMRANVLEPDGRQRRVEHAPAHVGGVEGRNLRESMHRFKNLLSGRFGVDFGEHWRDEGCKCQLLPIYLGSERVLVTGEAAGFIYLNCEGISAAMDSGYRCGTSLARALNSNGGSAAELYADSCKDIIAHQEKCMSQMHFLAKAPPFI